MGIEWKVKVTAWTEDAINSVEKTYYNEKDAMNFVRMIKDAYTNAEVGHKIELTRIEKTTWII